MFFPAPAGMGIGDVSGDPSLASGKPSAVQVRHHHGDHCRNAGCQEMLAAGPHTMEPKAVPNAEEGPRVTEAGWVPTLGCPASAD